jgi:D-lactate dehydrogenase (cytochrome)
MAQAPIQTFGDDHADYLRDESRKVGSAASISFPSSEDEVAAVLAETAAEDKPVTVQGGRTGITAGAVPQGGHVLNLSRMNRVLGLRRDPQTEDFLLRVPISRPD